MEVRVKIKRWGTYSEGDILQMEESTALACIKSGAVEKVSSAKESKEQKDSPKKDKK